MPRSLVASPRTANPPKIAFTYSAPDRSLSVPFSTPQGQVLRILADGHRHSGEHLAQALGVTQATVRQQLAKLEAWGLSVEVTSASGYHLDRPINFLNKALILDELNADVERLVARLDVHEEIDSTNQALLDGAEFGVILEKTVIAIVREQSGQGLDHPRGQDVA